MTKQAVTLDDFYREFGGRVRSLRADRLTQLELSERVGLSRAAVANIELGRQRVAMHMLFEFADALGVDADALLPDATQTMPRGRAGTEFANLSPRDQSTVLRVMKKAREAATNVG